MTAENEESKGIKYPHRKAEAELIKIFEDKVKEYKRSSRWFSGFFIFIILVTILLAILLAIFWLDPRLQDILRLTAVLTETTPSKPNGGGGSALSFYFYPLILTISLAIGGSTTWFLLFLSNRRGESKKLEEMYKHKEVMMRVFIGYREMLEKTPDGEKKDRNQQQEDKNQQQQDRNQQQEDKNQQQEDKNQQQQDGNQQQEDRNQQEDNNLLDGLIRNLLDALKQNPSDSIKSRADHPARYVLPFKTIKKFLVDKGDWDSLYDLIRNILVEAFKQAAKEIKASSEETKDSSDSKK